jgi:hypothetical protein
MRIVKELETVEIAAARHPRRRIVVIGRDDGFYSYAEQYHFVSEYDGEILAQGWHTVPFDGVYETSRIAEAEGRSAFEIWHGVAY